MGKVYFLFGVHNHQPVGNHNFVFEEAFERCYLPFIDVLKEFPEIKCNIHISGPVYEWALSNCEEYVGKLKEMAKSGQIEIVSGGYYEPILSIIPDSDKFAQIRLMNEFIKKEFNQAPKGMWLAERIWEPQLANVISKAGLKYTFLDDIHFRGGGIRDQELTGYYLTEDYSGPIAVFPINKNLRFRIPFSKPEEAIELLKSFSQKKDALATLFDDGEKFGLWPTTYEWIYQKEWLRKFFKLIVKNNKIIETITASDALKNFKPNGIVYLPTSSYREMDEWVMEPEEFYSYGELGDYIKKHPKASRFKSFLRAGFFRNYFRKYPRLNYMHKRMLYLSENICKKASVKNDKEIFRHLWKSQCNCGYWHGLFGGFYLGNIRAAVYENLIKAEKELDEKQGGKPIIIEKADFDFDGLEETIVKNKHLISAFSDKGATLLELSFKDKNLNLLNTITRREESYHKKIKGRARKELTYDKYERLSLIDHLLDKKITIGDFDKQRKFRTLSGDIYKSSIAEKNKSAVLSYNYSGEKLEFKKKISLTAANAAIKARYVFKNAELLKKYDFGVEFNLFFQSPDDVMFYAKKGKTALNKKKIFKKINNLKISDRFKDIFLRFDFSKADVFIMPIYSISNSQLGPEKMCQEASILFIKKDKGKRFNIGIEIESGATNL